MTTLTQAAPKQQTAARRRLLLALACAVTLTGCKAISGAYDGAKAMVGLGPAPVKPDWKTLALRADEHANANSATAVDLVFVRDIALLESLLAMPASKWFSSRADLQRSFPDTLTVLSYELVPGQALKINEAQWRDVSAWGVLAFASYAGAGEHRARLMLETPGYLIHLGPHSFSAIDVKPGAAK